MASSDMLRAYRLVSTQWATTALSGEGARLYGGRWNSMGWPVVYLGLSRALCALETLAHLSTPESRQKSFCFIEVSLPINSIESISVAILPAEWALEPPTFSSQQFGDEWLRAGRTLGLTVPSAIIPEEMNLLLNPRHRDFQKVQHSHPQLFRFDRRL